MNVRYGLLILIGVWLLLQLPLGSGCQTQKACTDDTICSTGEICLQNLCVQGCRTHQQCSKQQSCIQNRCKANLCASGASRPCYESAQTRTLGVGNCRAGLQFCTQEGQWSRCSGQVLPQPEQCDQADNDCNGKIDDVSTSCVCPKPGETRQCYSGPSGTLRKGVCKAGTQTCLASHTWGKCFEQILPSPEVCNGKDDDCNGKIDDRPQCTTTRERTLERTTEQASERTTLEHRLSDGGELSTERFTSESRPELQPEGPISGRGFATLWIKTTQSPPASSLTISSIARSNSGAIFAVGQVNLSATFDKIYPNLSKTCGFIAKLDPKQRWEWARFIGCDLNSGPNMGMHIRVDSKQDIVVVGYFTQNRLKIEGQILQKSSEMTGWIAKYSPSGSLRWARSFPVNKKHVRIAINSKDQIAVLGTLGGSGRFGSLVSTPQKANDENAFVALLQPEGTWIAIARSAGRSNQGIDVLFDRQDDLHMLGTFKQQIRFGSATLHGGSEARGFIAHMSGLGSQHFTWKAVRAFGGPNAILYPQQMLQHTSSTIVVVGSTRGQFGLKTETQSGIQNIGSIGQKHYTGFIVSFDIQKKKWIWVTPIQPISDTQLYHVTRSSSGKLWVSGRFAKELKLNSDPKFYYKPIVNFLYYFVARLSTKGEWENFGVTGHSKITGLLAGPSSTLLLSGFFQGRVPFFERRLLASNQQELFIWKILYTQ